LSAAWNWGEENLLPQIDHLTADQLRRRAADDRADAQLLDPQKHSGAIRMLLADAERCEALVDSRKAARPSPIDGLACLGAEAEAELLTQALNGCLVFEPRALTGLSASICR